MILHRQHPLIIVEGTDNSGKTTVAKELASQSHGVYINSKHRPPPSVTYLLEYQEILGQISRFTSVVTDRHPAISESVYGPIIRGSCSLRTEREVNFCLEEAAAIVYCCPPADLVLASLPEREQMAGVAENILALREAYDQFFASERWPVYRYDYTTRSAEELYECIVADVAYTRGG